MGFMCSSANRLAMEMFLTLADSGSRRQTGWEVIQKVKDLWEGWSTLFLKHFCFVQSMLFLSH